MDYLRIDFDFDGDGVTDAQGEEYDTNGDGQGDMMFLDRNMDGNVDSVMYDTDGDGQYDYVESDTNGDGYVDTVSMDTDGDGMEDTYFVDTDGDGELDTVLTNDDLVEQETFDQTDEQASNDQESTGLELDIDGDGNVDTIFEDTDGDGVFDLMVNDSDGDGEFDTVAALVDTDGDGVQDSIEVHVFEDVDGDGVFDIDNVMQINEQTGEVNMDVLDVSSESNDVDDNDTSDHDSSDEDASDKSDLVEIEPIFYDDNDNGLMYYDLDNFDPDSADMDNVVGDPETSMELWECQGDTNRCALYSQMFMIEELTGQDIDIEEFADIAEENGWFTEEGGTMMVNTDKMLQYYGLETDMSDGNSFSDLAEALNDGEKVLVCVDADEYWSGEDDSAYTPADGPNHAIEVIGIDYSDPDNPMVIINDSGNPDGCGCMIPYQTFMDAWEDSNFFMVTATE